MILELQERICCGASERIEQAREDWAQGRFDIRSAYVERFWLGVLVLLVGVPAVRRLRSRAVT